MSTSIGLTLSRSHRFAPLLPVLASLLDCQSTTHQIYRANASRERRLAGHSCAVATKRRRRGRECTPLPGPPPSSPFPPPQSMDSGRFPEATRQRQDQAPITNGTIRLFHVLVR